MDAQQLTPALAGLRLDESDNCRHLLPSPNPNADHIPNANPNLRSASPNAEGSEEKRVKGKGSDHLDLAFSDVPWPCEDIPSLYPEATTGWSNSWVHAPIHTPAPPSAEDQALIAAYQLQSNGLKASLDFFTNNRGGSDEEDGETEEDSGDEDDDGSEKGRVFLFFMDLFKKDEDLRGYYKNNWEKGNFYCLVCWGIGKKVWKRFGNCAGVVHHANSISKTKRRLAHREFGRAICWLLGWDTCDQDHQSLSEVAVPLCRWI